MSLTAATLAAASRFARIRSADPAETAARPARLPALRVTCPQDKAREACRLSRDIASVMCDVPSAEIARSARSASDICQARHIAMYLAHVVFQVPLATIAAHFGRDRTGIAYAIRKVEDRRDDRHFDAELTRMERFADLCRPMMRGEAGDAVDPAAGAGVKATAGSEA